MERIRSVNERVRLYCYQNYYISIWFLQHCFLILYTNMHQNVSFCLISQTCMKTEKKYGILIGADQPLSIISSSQSQPDSPRLILLLVLLPAQPGGPEPAPLRQHDGARLSRPDVLRAGQGDGFASKLPRLYFFSQARPGPCGLPWFQGHSACNQPQGGSSSLTFFNCFLSVLQLDSAQLI